MVAAIIAASSSIVVAAMAFLLNQYSQVKAERRQLRLARVGSQLRDLYGPLYALVDVNERIWSELKKGGVPSKEDRAPETLAVEWSEWLYNSLMPANVKMRNLIIEHGDLVIECTLPEPLQAFCAHVGYQEAAFPEGAPPDLRGRVYIGHPGDSYVYYVRSSFEFLKAEQQRLLGPRPAGGRPGRR